MSTGTVTIFQSTVKPMTVGWMALIEGKDNGTVIGESIIILQGAKTVEQAREHVETSRGRGKMAWRKVKGGWAADFDDRPSA